MRGKSRGMLAAGLAIGVAFSVQFAGAGSAWAQAKDEPAPREAVIVARAYSPLPKVKIISLQGEDNSDLNSRLHGLVSAEMQRLGYKLGENGDVTLYYNASAPVTEPTADRGTRRSAVRGSTDPRTDRGQLLDQAEPQFRVRPQGVLGQPESSILDTYSMNVIVTERGGVQYWVGTATTHLPRADSYEVSVSLTKALFREFGRTVSSQRVPLE
ncbi:MAG TPA: hypothetical protein VMV26_05465 [Alphaproteobacteria bacterium]|nr:hypothetical protein [Alphaproteobacteria bacterium]